MIEGRGCGQHGEDRVLAFIFRDQPEGVVVDVGAADGYWNSNSMGLLHRPGWRGILIEPEPSQFKKLLKLYRDRPNTTCLNLAIGKSVGVQTLFCGGQVSTFKHAVKRAAEAKHGIDYTKAQVQMEKLSKVLSSLADPVTTIDFLSIDVEGMNYEAWQTLDTAVYFPKLVSIEGKGYRMDGYRQLCRVGCNTFYLREDLCEEL